MTLVLNRPQLWPKAARDIHLECGPHQIAAVLSAHGHIVCVDDLYSFELLRRFDWMLPWDPGIVMRRYGVESKLHFFTRGSFAKQVKELLAVGRPVLFIIHSIQGHGRLHWISAWGYDEARDALLCYDSQCESTEGIEGNVRYSAIQLLAALPRWGGTFVVEIAPN